MKNLSFATLVFLTISTISNTDYKVRVSYNYNYDDDYTYDYDDYYDRYDSYAYDPYYSYNSYSSSSYNLYQRERDAEIAYQDAQIARLKAKLARLKYRNASRYLIIDTERELQNAIYERYPHFRYNPKAANEFLVGMGIVFIIAGLFNS